MGYVQTVLGRIPSDELGITLMHEHLWLDLNFRFREAKDPEKRKLGYMPVSIEFLGMLRRNPHLSKDNLRLDDELVASNELIEFKKYGGKTIVEQTVWGLSPNPIALKGISKSSGVNVIASTGCYRYSSHPTYLKELSVDQIGEIMVTEIEEGIGNTGIKAGVIGECATSTPRPYHQQEKRVLQAACRAQRKTGVGFTFHHQYSKDDFKSSEKVRGKAYEYYADIIESEGADLEKFFLSHCEGTLFDLDYQCRMMDKGVTLAYDNFGIEYYYDYAITAVDEDPAKLLKEGDWNPVPIGTRTPLDFERVKAVAELCKRGYEKKLLISHDVCHKTELKRYGGHGYSHILETIIPWLRQEGVAEKQIRTMLVQNPKRILSR